MTNNKQNNHTDTEEMEIIPARLRQGTKISPFWLLPLIALCIGAILFFQIIREQGHTIKITFASGDGLVANKTQVRYQGLQIGIVKKVNFTDDLKWVEVEANIYPEAKTVLRETTRFWLVQPSASLAGISGLDALVSGNYITLQPGSGDYKYNFTAETESPIAQVSDGDLLIRLIADDLGSISAGASVYFKKIPVGKIYDYRFSKDQNKVEIQLVINKSYANLVKKDSRFWNISGINANVSMSEINVNIDSLNAVVQGAVSFDSPPESPNAEQNTIYTLYTNLQAAQRGIEIDVELPNVLGLKAGKTEIYYQNTPIGILSELSAAEVRQEKINGKLLVDPNIANLFRTDSYIVLRNNKLSLTNLSDLPNLLRGEYMELIPGEGEESRQFSVFKETELLLKQPDTLVFDLTAPETYGVSEGQKIYYNSIAIGELVEQQVDVKGVIFKAAVSAEYRNLIRADSRFIAASNLDVAFGLDGLRFQAASPEKWLQGGVRVVSGPQNQGNALQNYPLYRDLTHAEVGITGNELTPSITLHSTHLTGISAGSLVLYRQYEVGKILDVRPQSTYFEVDVFIYPKYKKLLTDKSLFWVESAAQIDITPKGISIQATPIIRSLKGAISFDNSGGGRNKTLYANELRAKSAGQVISLTTDNAANLSKGMSLRYMGLTVGEIESINLDQKSKKIIAKALVNPNYMGIIAKEGSEFRVIAPQINAGGIENLDSLLQPYIDVDMGAGKTKTEFAIIDANIKPDKFNSGFPIILETNDAANLSVGAPIMYRGVEVGKIRTMELNRLGDRVLIHIVIGNKHQHLVRQNSEFWFSSGYTAELGWSGFAVNTGSMQQLLKGGISFSTPSGTIVQPQAKANQRFLLQIKRPEDAKTWNQGTRQ